MSCNGYSGKFHKTASGKNGLLTLRATNCVVVIKMQTKAWGERGGERRRQGKRRKPTRLRGYERALERGEEKGRGREEDSNVQTSCKNV